MNNSKKKNIIAVSFIILAVIIAALVFINSGKTSTSSVAVESVKEIKTSSIVDTEIPKSNPVMKKKTVKFRSNDEIKKVYGKIETVYLYNGKIYTGAVENDNEKYKIITVDGIFEFPMKDVKLRELIR